eukprot:4979846-Amphidinium_carterae.1
MAEPALLDIWGDDEPLVTAWTIQAPPIHRMLSYSPNNTDVLPAMATALAEMDTTEIKLIPIQDETRPSTNVNNLLAQKTKVTWTPQT